MIVKQTMLTLSPCKRFTDITEDVQKFLLDIQAQDGIVIVSSMHTTVSVRVLEDETLSLKDISNHLDEVASEDREYLHDDIMLRNVPVDERVNGVSHVRSLYFNTSETLPVRTGKLVLGEWQTLFLVELDPFRERRLTLTFIGSPLLPNLGVIW